jgi:site-specific DNA-methyltransferase (adenine-specific)
MLKAMRSALGLNDMMAYLAMMAVRLLELHRVLKPTGSLYLHCDPTASHYLKILLDSIFGGVNFLSEVVWKRTGTHSSAAVGDRFMIRCSFTQSAGASRCGTVHTFHFRKKQLASHYRKTDAGGRRYEHGELTGAGVRRGRSGAIWRGFDVTSIGTTLDHHRRTAGRNACRGTNLHSGGRRLAPAYSI